MRHNEQRVDADVVAVPGKARRQPLGSHCDPPQPTFIRCPGGGLDRIALLDLDKGDGPASASDQVDLSTRYSGPASKDSPALQSQAPGGQRLRLAPARLGRVPVQSLPPSSSARA